MRRARIAAVSVLAFLGALGASGGVSPAQADARRGQKLAQEKCGACHAVGKHGTSPNLKAPVFRRIANQWPPEQLQESLAEGIVTGHNDMPEFTFSTRQIDDLVDHLNALRKAR